VFPVIEQTKRPLIKDNLERASSEEAFVRNWWCRRNFNIGIATGPGSGVWVLDLDGLAVDVWLQRAEAEHGPLPATVTAATARGRHFYFRWPDDGAELRNIQFRDDFPDVRGAGGYVLAPPSVHPDGPIYAWAADSAREFADAPPWLLDQIRNINSNGNGGGEPIAAPPEVWRSFVDDRFEGSHRGRAISQLAGLLLRKYIDPFVALSLCGLFNEGRCVEPLPSAEVYAIVSRIADREARRREHNGGRP
jgi:hypothetical protein